MSALGQTRSLGDVASMSGLPESGHGAAIYEYARLVEVAPDVPIMRLLEGNNIGIGIVYQPICD
jgi:hypothetical protein